MYVFSPIPQTFCARNIQKTCKWPYLLKSGTLGGEKWRFCLPEVALLAGESGTLENGKDYGKKRGKV